MESPKFWKLVEKYISWIQAIILGLSIGSIFLLYTFDRSFRTHQGTISKVLQWNDRPGLFCSKVHVGHDGTTLSFQAVPAEVGTAGPIPIPIETVPQDFTFDSSLWVILLTVLLLNIFFIVFTTFYIRNKKKEIPIEKN